MRLKSFFVTLVLFSIGCGGSAAAPDPYAGVAGTYSLVQVNGKILPVTDVTGFTYTSGTLYLNADQTFDEQANFTRSDGFKAQSREIGSYTVSGTLITFVPQGGNGQVATSAFANGQVTFSYNGPPRLFVKQ
jgi:hypothetical protein